MKTVSISRLKARLSEYLDAVRTGEEVVITDRGRPVARLEAVRDVEGSRDRRAGLIRKGLLSPRREHRRATIKPPPGKKPSGVLRALLEERVQGR